MITQKEIARRLGISRTTVARAINGSSLIKEETRRKVLELVKETNYEKNYIGSSLGTKKNKKIYALVAESKNKYYTKAIKKGLQEVAREYKHYNFNLSIVATDINSPERQLIELKKILENEEIDGLIITPLDHKKALKYIKPYLDKIKVISLGIKLDKNIFHVGPDHKKQGVLVAGIMDNLLRDNERVLVIDNGDDNVSSKLYLEGFLKRIKETKLEIIGPVEGNGIESSIKIIEDYCKNEKIDGIYINRYAHDILDQMDKELLKGKKIVLNGMGRITDKLIKEKVVVATVREDVISEGYNSGKRMFDFLYKNEEIEIKWDVSKLRIVFNENLES